MPDAWELAAIAAKSVLYFGALTSSGLVIVRFLFASLVTDILPSIRRFALFCSALGLTAALASFALRGATLTGDASGITDANILQMMWQTPVGTALSFRTGGLSLMMLGLLLGGFGWVMALFGAAGALWSFSTIGHVADEAASWTNFVLFFHLVAVSIWIGILFPLGRLANQAKTAFIAGKLGHRFGQIAAVVVPLLVFAGFLLSWQLVGSWTALYTTSYGITLLLKLASVAGLLALGALNKIHIVPRIVTNDLAARRSLTRMLKLEWIAFTFVFVATTTLTTLFAVPVR